MTKGNHMAYNDPSLEAFAKIGRANALEAIDQIASCEDARGEYEVNLRDTLAEQHKDATPAQIDACIDTYRAVWDNYSAASDIFRHGWLADEQSLAYFDRYIAGDR